MNFKSTYILFGVLAGMLVLLGVALVFEPSPGDNSGYVLPSAHDALNPLKPEDVTEVTIQRDHPAAETLVFVKDPDSKRWQIKEPRELRADRSAVEDLVRQVLDAQRDPKADRPRSLKDWGLDNPAEVITLKKGSEREVSLKIGDTSAGTGSAVVYVLSSDRPKEPLAVRKSQLASVLKPLNEFRDRTVLANSSSEIQSVKLSEGKKGPVAFKKTSDNRWRFVEPQYGFVEEGDTAAPAGTSAQGIRPLLNALADLKINYRDEKDNDFVADDVTNLAQYHLDPAKDDVLRVEIERGEGDKTSRAVLLVGVGKKAGDKEEKYFARLEDEKSVFKVPSKGIDDVRKVLDDPAQLRDRNLVLLTNFKTPDAVDVKNSSGLIEFRKEEPAGTWQMYRGESAQAVDSTSVQNLVTALTQKGLVKSFLDPKTRESDVGLQPPAAVVSLWVEGVAKEEKKEDTKDGNKKDEKKEGEKKDENKEEKKPTKPKLKEPDKPLVRLSFGHLQGDQVVVKREEGGEVTLVKVPEAVFKQVNQGPLAYLDKSLPQFTKEFDVAKDVTRLEIRRGGTTYEVARDKEGEPWKLKKPEDLAGRTADGRVVQDILGVLNRLHATRLVAEKAKDDAELDREYGLKPPAVKAVVTVTKDGKATTSEYDFGKEEDKTGVFARQGQRDMIFVTDRTVLDTLQKDLRDPAVFHFDVAKVKSVKLVGWQSLLGAPFTLEVERKDDKWSAKTPAGFNLDSAKVRKFLEDLSALKAERFVSAKPANKAENDLEVAKGALEVEITLEDKDVLQLTVGKAEGDKDYLATSNKVPGLFAVPKALFDKVREKPASFSP